MNTALCPLLQGRKYYKPFKYDEFYDRWKTHERSHWLPSEVSMVDDINDWNNKLNENQRKFLTNIFRFFTQGDVDVAGAYCTQYIPNFSQTPEIAMFLTSVAAREAIHIDAYSYLIETLGMPESTYKEFLEYKEMSDKQEYIKKFQEFNYGALGDKKFGIFTLLTLNIVIGLLSAAFNNTNIFALIPLTFIIALTQYNNRQRLIKEHIAAGIALFSGFTEGMQLFSSFTMLLSFPMNGMMKGMGQIITWSIVDETQHTEGMIKLFKIFVEENSVCKSGCSYLFGCGCIRKNILKKNIYKIAQHMVELEDSFINLAYSAYSDDEVFLGISKNNLKKYIRFIANKRLSSMGYEYLFEEKVNPLPEFEIMINAPINTNFFENKSTDYARITNNDWSKVWAQK